MARNFADEIQAVHALPSIRSIRAHPRNQRFSFGILNSSQKLRNAKRMNSYEFGYKTTSEARRGKPGNLPELCRSR